MTCTLHAVGHRTRPDHRWTNKVLYFKFIREYAPRTLKFRLRGPPHLHGPDRLIYTLALSIIEFTTENTFFLKLFSLEQLFDIADFFRLHHV